MAIRKAAAVVIALIGVLSFSRQQPASLACSDSANALSVDQLPKTARQAALEYVDAIYAFNIKQMQELVEPELQKTVLTVAYNGPNTVHVTVIDNPIITEGQDCGGALRLTVHLRVAQGDKQRYQVGHTIRLILHPHGDRWRIVNVSMTADAD